MKVQYYTASSLDGFIATDDHSLDWLLQFSIDESSYTSFIIDVGAMVMGSSTYEWILSNAMGPNGSWPYHQPCWVFTTRQLSSPSGADVRFASGDVAAVHAEIVAAAGGKNVWVVGGGDLAGKYHEAGLLDELIVQIAPVTLGSGRPVFPREVSRPPLRLISAEVFGDALVEVRYDLKPQ